MKRNSIIPLLLVTLAASQTITALAQSTRPAASTPTAASTQASSQTGFKSEFLRQFEDAEKKVLALAEAVPQEKYSWRPSEGVRSMSEVFMHIAGGNYFLASFAGAKRPDGLQNLEKIADKAKVIEALKQSFDHVRQALQNTSDADLTKSVKMFGRDTTIRDVFFTIATHAHEHLGQSIAYVRMNNITPPWSRQP